MSDLYRSKHRVLAWRVAPGLVPQWLIDLMPKYLQVSHEPVHFVCKVNPMVADEQTRIARPGDWIVAPTEDERERYVAVFEDQFFTEYYEAHA